MDFSSLDKDVQTSLFPEFYIEKDLEYFKGRLTRWFHTHGSFNNPVDREEFFEELDEIVREIILESQGEIMNSLRVKVESDLKDMMDF